MQEALYDALPLVLVVVYGWSPIAYMKGFSVFVCDDFAPTYPLDDMPQPPREPLPMEQR